MAATKRVNTAERPVGDDYLAERCDEYERVRAVCLAFAARRFPAGSTVYLPNSCGGGRGVVIGVRAEQRVEVVAHTPAPPGVLIDTRHHFVPVADLLRVNPRQGGDE